MSVSSNMWDAWAVKSWTSTSLKPKTWSTICISSTSSGDSVSIVSWISISAKKFNFLPCIHYSYVSNTYIPKFPPTFKTLHKQFINSCSYHKFSIVFFKEKITKVMAIEKYIWRHFRKISLQNNISMILEVINYHDKEITSDFNANLLKKISTNTFQYTYLRPKRTRLDSCGHVTTRRELGRLESNTFRPLVYLTYCLFWQNNFLVCITHHSDQRKEPYESILLIFLSNRNNA